VNFFDGAVTLGTRSLDASGTASLTASGLANGSHLLTAEYVGNNLHAASTSTQLQVDVAPAAIGEQAFQADSLVDSAGVATHLSYTDTPYYTAWPQVLSEIQSLGVRHIRDGFYNWPSNSEFILEHQALAAAGVTCTYVIPLDNATTPQIIQSFASKVHDLEAVEAPNECDAGANCGGGGAIGVANAVAFLPTVYAAGQALHVPVLGPSFTVASAYSTAGNIASEMTYNNLHVYFGGRNPGSAGWGDGDAQGHSYGSVDWWIDQGNMDAPGVPSIITESGYMAYPQTILPYTLPESVDASYIPRTLLVAFNRGIKRTFLYELLDEVSSPGYGLLRSDLSEKPAFTAVKNLLSLLSDQGPTFSPGKLNYTIDGAGPTLNHTLLQKRDGSFWLILWLEQSSYDPAVNLPIQVSPQILSLQIHGPAVAKQVVQFDSTGNAATTTVTGSGSTLSLSISDQLSIIHITPP
jgi:Bacterial Ig-like domain (group 3)